MDINRVDYAGRILIDLSGDTLNAAGQISSGVTAHDKSGTQITGTNPYNATNVGSALSASLDALAEKGVAISGSEGIADLAGLIAEIETGGQFGINAIHTGTFTPASHITSSYTINTGVYFGDGYSYVLADSFYYFFLDMETPKSSNGGRDANEILYLSVLKNIGVTMYPGSYGVDQKLSALRGSDLSANTTSNTMLTPAIDSETKELTLKISCSSTRRLISGKQYSWVVAERRFRV